MTDISPETEAALRNMSDTEWSTFTAKVRPPDTTEGLREAASQFLSDETLDSFVRTANVSAFTGDDGTIDPSKVTNHLSKLLGIMAPGPTATPRPQWGQGTSQIPGAAPGYHGKAEAFKRRGLDLPEPGHHIDPKTPAAATSAGRAEAERRRNGARR